MDEQVSINTEDTVPVERCECGDPGEWVVHYTGFDAGRDPPYRFWSKFFCHQHVPDEALNSAPEWVRDYASRLNVYNDA